MEWYGAFGLMVTIVWLYLEILNLLSKISQKIVLETPQKKSPANLTGFFTS
jgi:hypothetical protein